MIKAALVVQSRELSLDQISAVMARRPDSGYERGSLSPVGKVPRAATSWSLELDWPRETHGGTEGLAAAIESLGRSVAEHAATLAAQGCDVVVSVCQELADDPASVGLHLTPEAIKWLAMAGATVDVDQYVESETEAP
jgi:hypothetical protein